MTDEGKFGLIFLLIIIGTGRIEASGVLYVAKSANAANSSGGIYKLADGSISAVVSHIEPIDVSYDLVHQRLYWVDNIIDVFMSASSTGSDIRLEANTSTSDMPQYIDGVYVDSSSQILYYTDIIYGAVVAYDIATKKRAFIAEQSSEIPRDIHVHGPTKTIFWTDWGAVPSVWTAEGDGSNLKQLGRYVSWTAPNGLHYDSSEQQLYVCDVTLSTRRSTKLIVLNVPSDYKIQSVSYSNVHCFDITGNSSHLFMSDWVRSSIFIIPKSDLSSMDLLYTFPTGQVNGIQFVPNGPEPGSNPCNEVSCPVNRMCVPRSSTQHTCLCEMGRAGDYCSLAPLPAYPSFIIPTTNSVFGLVGLPASYLRYGSFRSNRITISDDYTLNDAVTVDSHTDTLYAYSQLSQSIISISIVETRNRVQTIRRNVEFVTSMAVDWTTHVLYLTLYSGIHMLSLSTGNMAQLYSTSDTPRPISITVDPAKGHIYWCSFLYQRLERMNTDGTGHVVLSGSYYPTAIALDLSDINRRIYLATSSEIYSLDEAGKNPKQLVSFADSYQTIEDFDFHSGYLSILTRNITGGKRLYFSKVDTFTTPTAHIELGTLGTAVLAYNINRQPGVVKDCESLRCEEFCISSRSGQPKCLCLINPSACSGKVPTTSSTKMSSPSFTNAVISTTSRRAIISTTTRSLTSATTKNTIEFTTTETKGSSDWVIPVTASIVVVGVVAFVVVIAFVCYRYRNKQRQRNHSGTSRTSLPHPIANGPPHDDGVYSYPDLVYEIPTPRIAAQPGLNQQSMYLNRAIDSSREYMELNATSPPPKYSVYDTPS